MVGAGRKAEVGVERLGIAAAAAVVAVGVGIAVARTADAVSAYHIPAVPA